MYIDCLWVSGKFKGQFFSNSLLQKCIKDSKEKGKKGLVNTDSAVHGHFMGIVKGRYKRGISHGDVIDLFREDIPGYDVQEFYVDLVKQLKEKGF